MLNKDIYAIFTNDDERGGSVKELYSSFDKAKADRFKYANWCCSKGDIWIELFEAGKPFRSSHSWHMFPDGSIVNEYNY